MRIFYITTFVCLFFVPTMAQKISDRKIRREIKRIEAFKSASIAIALKKIKTTKSVVSYYDDHYMTPASNTKLLTFLGAVQHFDSLPNLLYYKENDSIIHFRSTGYPLLLHPLYEDVDLTNFFKEQKQLVYHPEKEKIARFGRGWSWDDYPYYYSAEKSSFPIYGNVVKVKKDSLASSLMLSPTSFLKKFQIDSLESTQKLHRLETKNQFLLNPKKWQANTVAYYPFLTGDSLFVSLLSKAVNRPTRFAVVGERPNKWKTNYTHNTDRLYQALLQDSDNLIAESILLMIAKKRTDTLNTEKAIQLLKADWKFFLPDPLEWVDGSGLSRYNMFTPRSLVTVLEEIHRNIGMEKIKILFPSTSLSGIKKDPKGRLASYVYAKTGTLRHNLCLSGYLIGPKETPYVFSIMVNHTTAPNKAVRDGIGTILAYLRKKL